MEIEERKKLVETAARDLADCNTGAVAETRCRAELEKQVALLQAESSVKLSSNIQAYTDAIESSNSVSEKVQKNILKLNRILTIATCVAAIATTIIAYLEFSK